MAQMSFFQMLDIPRQKKMVLLESNFRFEFDRFDFEFGASNFSQSLPNVGNFESSFTKHAFLGLVYDQDKNQK